MKDHSTMQTRSYIIDIIWNYVIGLVWYKILLFRLLPDHGIDESVKILLLMVAVTLIIGGILFRRWKTKWMSIALVLLPFGVYTVIAYKQTVPKLIWISLVCAALCAVIHIMRILIRKIEPLNKGIRSMIIKERVLRGVYGIVCIFACSFFLIMVGINLHGSVGRMLDPTVVNAEATSEESDDANTFNKHKDTILKLQPDVWQTLTSPQKLDVLQIIVNIEATYLGLPQEVTVVADPLSPVIAGTYIDELKLIKLNWDVLEGSSYEALRVTLHEIHHSYEHAVADLYESLDAEDKQLRMFKQAASYAEEREHYVDVFEDYNAYIEQQMELDSDAYAERAVEVYRYQIACWVAEDNGTPLGG